MAERSASKVDINEPRYTLKEAGPMFGRTSKTLRHWITNGRLSVLNIKGRLFVQQSEIQRILDQSFVPSKDEL